MRAQRGGALTRILQRALDVARRSASGDVVEGEDFSETEGRLEAGVEAGVDGLQVDEGQFLQIASTLDSDSYGLAYGFVGEA